MSEQTIHFENSGSDLAEDISLQLPPEKSVIFYNDDFTTMDFVTEILVSVYDKTTEQAEGLMMEVHNKGSACIGTYTYDIAVSRVNLTRQLARQNGFPLRVEVE